LFGQANYHITDTLRVTGGIRYTWDERSISVGQVVTSTPPVCNTGPGIGTNGNCLIIGRSNFSYPSWLASADYQVTPSTLIYAKTSGASLSGGFNANGGPPQYEAFAPENVTDVELGLKNEYFSHRLRTNIAAFHVRRDDVQSSINAYDPATNALSQYVTNAGNVLSDGVEFEGTARPWLGMEASTAFSYLHSRYQHGSFLVPGRQGPVDHSGERVLGAPKWTLSVGGTQAFEIAPMIDLSVHLDYSYTSAIAQLQDTPDRNNPMQNPAVYAEQNRLGTLPGYGLINGRVAVNFGNPDLEVAVFVRNLTGKQYYTGSFVNWVSLGEAVYNHGPPRMYGVTTTWRW
jgi:iron complex outermembrane receptor protein